MTIEAERSDSTTTNRTTNAAHKANCRNAGCQSGPTPQESPMPARTCGYMTAASQKMATQAGAWSVSQFQLAWARTNALNTHTHTQTHTHRQTQTHTHTHRLLTGKEKRKRTKTSFGRPPQCQRSKHVGCVVQKLWTGCAQAALLRAVTLFGFRGF